MATTVHQIVINNRKHHCQDCRFRFVSVSSAVAVEKDDETKSGGGSFLSWILVKEESL